MEVAAPARDGPYWRAGSIVAYPLLLTATIGGGAWAVHAQLPGPAILPVAFFFMMGSGVLLEWLYPADPNPRTAPRVHVELINSAVNLVLNARLFRPLLALGIMKLSVALTGRSGLLPPAWLGPIWLQAIFAFLLTDFGRYAVHRTQHRVPALWALHKVHHSVEKIRTFNLQFSHPLDYVLRNVVTFYIPVLLGICEQGIVLAVILQYATGIPSHFNARLRYGAFSQVLVTSRVHRWHHALDLEDGGDANFGAGLVLWDRLFGSFHLPADRPAPDEIGIAEGPPRSLVSTLLVP